MKKRFVVGVLLVPACTALLSGCSFGGLVSMSRQPSGGVSAVVSSPAVVPGAVVPGAVAPGARVSGGAGAGAVSTVRPGRSTFAVGALTHSVSSGGQVLAIRYWVVAPVSAWSGGVPPVVQFSAQLSGVGAGDAVRVTRVLATVGSAAGPVDTLIDDGSQPVLTPPYSYGNVLQLPAATKVSEQVSVEFDVLIQTAPKSSDYFRQVYLDTLPLSVSEVSQP